MDQKRENAKYFDSSVFENENKVIIVLVKLW